MSTHPIKYTPTARVVSCLLLARGALMKLRHDIDQDVEGRMLRDQLDAHCEKIQQALKLLDPISVGELAHSMPAAPPSMPVADDCDGEPESAFGYAANDSLPPHYCFKRPCADLDTAGPDQPNFSYVDTDGQ